MSRMKREARIARAQDDTDAVRDVEVRLRTLSSLSREVDFPVAIATALLTNRPEMVRATKPVAMDAEGVGRLYDVIEVLIETNVSLQAHARRLAQMTENLQGHLKGFASTADALREFAEFRVHEVEPLAQAA